MPATSRFTIDRIPDHRRDDLVAAVALAMAEVDNDEHDRPDWENVVNHPQVQAALVPICRDLTDYNNARFGVDHWNDAMNLVISAGLLVQPPTVRTDPLPVWAATPDLKPGLVAVLNATHDVDLEGNPVNNLLVSILEELMHFDAPAAQTVVDSLRSGRPVYVIDEA